MPASLLISALASALATAACAEDTPIGPLPDLGAVDLGTPDLGADAPADAAAPPDGGPRDARIDAADAAASDLGPIDLGRPCDHYDSGGLDLGPLYDLGPFVVPDLDAARIDYGVEPPGYHNGCVQLAWCTAVPTRDAGLTWDGYARDFFVTYCTRCHASTLAVDDAGTRHGAPPGYDWDDRARVYAHLIEIRTTVGVAVAMPYDDPAGLPCERRRELVTWIDEGAP